MKIATFNIQNRYLQENFLTDYEYIEKLIEFIKNNKLDILGLQEVVPSIKKELIKEFNFYGKGRFLLPTRVNEYNPVITNYNVISTETIKLPFLRSFLPRIATITTVNSDETLVKVINTHLCLYKYHTVKQKELDKIIDIIKNTETPIILMGDFNMKETSDEFKTFLERIKKLDMKLVPNKESTYNNSKLDYIFVSNAFKINEVDVIDSKISDHKALVVDLSL